MIARLLGIDQPGAIQYMEWAFRQAWPAWVVAALLAVAAGLALAQYARERQLSRFRRLFLGALRAALYAGVILILLEPVIRLDLRVTFRRTVLLLLDNSESMGIVDPRKTRSEILSAAAALGDVPFHATNAPVTDAAKAKVAKASRMDVLKAILAHPQLRLVERLATSYQTQFYAFGKRSAPLAVTPGDRSALAGLLPAEKATALGSAIRECIARHSGQVIAGVIVLTDGASNHGVDTLDAAQQAGAAGIPIFPVGIGLPHPPDLRLDNLIVPEIVFVNDTVPVRVRIDAMGIGARPPVDLVLRHNGREIARRSIQLPDKSRLEELPFTPEEEGTGVLQAQLEALPDEVVTENNTVSRNVRVIGDRIKVLYIEGKPRWEYRYLRQVLLRDRRMDVKFIITEGDQDLAKHDEHYLTRFPLEADQAFAFDLVILGDVDPKLFQKEELDRIEELIRERGGSFIALAGSQYNPVGYADTPVGKLLPVRIGLGVPDEVDGGIHPVVTPEGRRGTIMRLDPSDSVNDALWERVRPLYRLPLLAGVKPGAFVLAELSDTALRREPYPLICWQRYGTGKSMFVGTDQLWRLRFKTGDFHHARFWGQASQFLTLSRLLGENRRIRLETGSTRCRVGETLPVFATVLDETFQPVRRPAYAVVLERRDQEKTERRISLLPVPGAPGLYQGYVVAEQAGQYALRTPAEDRDFSNTAEFSAEAVELEQLDPAMREDSLRTAAELSGGRYVSLDELPSLLDGLTGKDPTGVVHRERDLWDTPFSFLVLLALASLEWGLRRKYDLV